jgi:hypothetical protein
MIRGEIMYVPIQEIIFLTYRYLEKINQNKCKEKILKTYLIYIIVHHELFILRA